MALTLPYPSMNFVPLDILTAAEQNQLVANIEYIANQFPITSANIGSQAVKSSNIDWSTYVYTAGDSVTKIYAGTAVTTSTTSGSIAYITIQLAKPISTGVFPSITSFNVPEIEKIGNGSSSNIINLQNSGGTTVTMDQTSMSASASIFPGTTDVVSVSIKPNTGYSWVGFQSYMTCNIRAATFNISFA